MLHDIVPALSSVPHHFCRLDLAGEGALPEPEGLATAVEGNGGLGRTQTYTIDAYGNRGMSTTMSAPQWDAPGYDAATNRLSSSGTGWVYDDAGNLTNTPFAAITYDAENRQKTFANEGNGTYFYDGAGRRVKEVWGGSTRVFVYDAFGQLAAEYGGTGASVGRRYVTGDHLGSVRLVTDGAGAVAERLDYTPYGEVIGTTGCGQPAGAGRSPRCDVAGYGSGGGGMRMKFTGKERDAETGLDFFLARYYSSGLGRFTSPDEWAGGIVDPFTGGQVGKPGPLPYADITDPQTINKYAYVRNNPLRYIDPTGHEIVGSGPNGQVVMVHNDLTNYMEDAQAGLLVGAANFWIGAINYNTDRVNRWFGTDINQLPLLTTDKGNQVQEEWAKHGESAAAVFAPGPKSAKDMASGLRGKIGKNSVSYETSRVKGHIDLEGKAHFDKATQTTIPTPHVQERPKSVGPNGQVNLGKQTTRPATKQDIRNAKRLAEEGK